MYCLAKEGNILAYYNSVEEVVKAYQKISEREQGWEVLSNYDPSLKNLSTCEKLNVEDYLSKSNFTNEQGKVRLRIKDMTPEQRRAYFADRGLDTKKPKKEVLPKPKREPTELELRYVENGSNMFRWSFFYHTLGSMPTISKTIWNLETNDKVRSIHDGINPNTGWTFILYDTKREKAVKRVEKYLKDTFTKEQLGYTSEVKKSNNYYRRGVSKPSMPVSKMTVSKSISENDKIVNNIKGDL